MRNNSLFFGVGALIAGAIYAILTKEKGEKDPDTIPKAPFDPNAGNPITRAEASEHVKKYKADHNKNIRANYCNKSIITELLLPTNCAGLRIYRARNKDKKYGIVLVGVDAQGNDILPGGKTTEAAHSMAEGQAVSIAESYEKCPHNCDGARLLR